jgi:hypothetical protein
MKTRAPTVSPQQQVKALVADCKRTGLVDYQMSLTLKRLAVALVKAGWRKTYPVVVATDADLIDAIVTAQVNDDSQWDAPLTVPPVPRRR